MERVFASGAEPIAALNQSLEELARFLTGAASSSFAELGNCGPGDNHASSSDLSIKEVTGEHYGQLFHVFSSKSYWDEPVQLLRQRLERNGLPSSELQAKSVLDAGCGGGRYTVAWRLLGAMTATGVDVSPININDARRRITQAGIDGVTFETGDVLELPVQDSSFDIVFSNGVLHHTTDWRRGIAELLRVLKPGGMGWLYLIEKPGGLFWDIIEILRAVLRDDERETARAALHALGIPANRIFYMLDHVMVPVNIRLTPEEIEEALSASSAISIRRLERGTDFDRIESIYQQEPHAEVKYGVGENRYVFSKE
jgi:ubiquinone/menaquinone biosynthesis C-methylase UbiE